MKWETKNIGRKGEEGGKVVSPPNLRLQIDQLAIGPTHVCISPSTKGQSKKTSYAMTTLHTDIKRKTQTKCKRKPNAIYSDTARAFFLSLKKKKKTEGGE